MGRVVETSVPLLDQAPVPCMKHRRHPFAPGLLTSAARDPAVHEPPLQLHVRMEGRLRVRKNSLEKQHRYLLPLRPPVHPAPTRVTVSMEEVCRRWRGREIRWRPMNYLVSLRSVARTSGLGTGRSGGMDCTAQGTVGKRGPRVAFKPFPAALLAHYRDIAPRGIRSSCLRRALLRPSWNRACCSGIDRRKVYNCLRPSCRL